MSLPLPYGIGVVDPQSPIDWSHPLNRGLVFEWSVVPNSGWSGGLRLRDLTRGGPSKPNDQTFQGTSPQWGIATHRGGFGGMLFSGSSPSYTSGSVPSLGTNSPYTVSAWVRQTSNPSAYRPVADTGQYAGLNDGWCLAHDGSNVFYFAVGNGYRNANSSLTSGRWYFLTGIYTGGSSTPVLYVDGVLQSGASATTTSTTPQTSLRIAYSIAANGQYFNGAVDGLAVRNRAISDAEAKALYAESASGNLNRWRWLLRGAWFPVEQDAGGGASPFSDLVNGGLVDCGLVNGGLVA